MRIKNKGVKYAVNVILTVDLKLLRAGTEGSILQREMGIVIKVVVGV